MIADLKLFRFVDQVLRFQDLGVLCDLEMDVSDALIRLLCDLLDDRRLLVHLFRGERGRGSVDDFDSLDLIARERDLGIRLGIHLI